MAYQPTPVLKDKLLTHTNVRVEGLLCIAERSPMQLLFPTSMLVSLPIAKKISNYNFVNQVRIKKNIAIIVAMVSQ